MTDSDVIVLPIVDVRVIDVSTEYALVLDLADDTRIRIESAFRFQDGSRERIYDPQCDVSDLDDFQSFVGSVVTEAAASSEGALRLVLGESAIIEVEPSETYEAWEFVGLKGLRLVAMGDRSLAVWDARNDA